MIREAVSCSIIPMLLGDNKVSRRLARRLFWRFSLRSHIFDRQSSYALKFMLSASFAPLPDTDSEEFTLLSLERFVCEHEGMTYLLVPCSRSAKKLIDRNRLFLEDRFIIRTPWEMMTSLREGEIPYDKI